MEDDGQLPNGKEVDFQITKWMPKRIYYSPTGQKMVLPADHYSTEHYLSKGFTFTPPLNPVPPTFYPNTAQTPDILSIVPKVKHKWHRKRKYTRKS